MKIRQFLCCLLSLILMMSLQSCGKGSENKSALHDYSGQVSSKAVTKVSHYAASRFAEQVSFGATPELVTEIEQKGFSAWIDDQFALPPSQIDDSFAKAYDHLDTVKVNQVSNGMFDQFYSGFISNPDQLRRRVSWAISQFVPVNANNVSPYGGMHYVNFLHNHAFGNYANFIEDLTTNVAMGEYLNNISNRPASSECIGCAPNENYARELMQLFTLGVVKLNPDGSIVRDAQNMPMETYTQQDVEQLAAALTGWYNPAEWKPDDYTRFDSLLVPDRWPPAHDRREKTVLGIKLAANQEADVELKSVTKILMSHPNIAPFISLRLIQHLVTSDPSPAYIKRISTIFRDNGAGVAGDMKAMVKAILLDPEARAGDEIGTDTNHFGKMREPVLWYTALLRGMGCNKSLRWSDGNVVNLSSQPAYNPSSVFSFYLPTDRAPGSNLLAPEQRLLNASEFADRIGGFNLSESGIAAGCNITQFGQAYTDAPQTLVDLIDARYFRSTMPPILRQNLIDLAPNIWGDDANQRAIALLQYALETPYFGVIK